MKREELLKQLEAIARLVREAISEEAAFVPSTQGLTTFDRAKLSEEVMRDPYVHLLVDAHDQLIALYKQVEQEAVSE